MMMMAIGLIVLYLLIMLVAFEFLVMRRKEK